MMVDALRNGRLPIGTAALFIVAMSLELWAVIAKAVMP